VIAPGRTAERRIDGNRQGEIDELATAVGILVERRTGRSATLPAWVVRGREAEVTGGLTRRMAVASGLLALIVGAAFAVLLVSVADLRTSERLARHSEQVLAAANQLERLVIDLETGQRGFVITGQERFLGPWRAARRAVPGQAGTLQRLVAGDPVQQRRALGIAQAATSYLRDYSVPLVAAARRDPASARTVAATQEGKRRVDAMRLQFDGLIGAEQRLAATRQERSDAAAGRAIGAAVGGFAGSVLLIGLFAGYLTRAIVRPVRGAAAMAGRLAAGDLGVRLPQGGVGEIGVLERSFNTMAGSLQASRAELAASRSRIVKAADNTRRRIERDLHDGIQQRLVSLGLDLRGIQAGATAKSPELQTQLGQIADGLGEALNELREISRGIHPAVLSEGGLGPALKALARRSAVPVEADLKIETRLPEPVEAAAYYVVAEALTNAAKHAHASTAHVAVQARDGRLHLSVRDDGAGGADPARGSGLIGLTDRVQARGGTITVRSPIGEGTTLQVELPTDLKGD
jgi:signal transduction histidine kinase